MRADFFSSRMEMVGVLAGAEADSSALLDVEYLDEEWNTFGEMLQVRGIDELRRKQIPS